MQNFVRHLLTLNLFSYFFTTIHSSSSRQQAHSLHMHRMTKLINRAHPGNHISIFLQIFQVPCQSSGITADIDNTLWCHGNHRFQTLLITSLTRWIYYNDIRMQSFIPILFMLVYPLWQHFLCFSNIKGCIIHLVILCIFSGICYCFRYNLYTINMLCCLCQKQRNRPNPTIQIPDHFLSRQICIFQCQTV